MIVADVPFTLEFLDPGWWTPWHTFGFIGVMALAVAFAGAMLEELT